MSYIRRQCVKWTQHKSFEAIILLAIVIDSVQLAYYYFMISEDELFVLMVIDRLFFALFTIEAALKITAQAKEYFKNRWNLFDFSILCSTVVILITMELFNIPQLKAFLRVLRICRILKLLNFKAMQKLINVRRLKIIL